MTTHKQALSCCYEVKFNRCLMSLVVDFLRQMLKTVSGARLDCLYTGNFFSERNVDVFHGDDKFLIDSKTLRLVSNA